MHYSNQSIHICKMRTFWARINDLDSDTYHVYLITWNFIFASSNLNGLRWIWTQISLTKYCNSKPEADLDEVCVATAKEAHGQDAHRQVPAIRPEEAILSDRGASLDACQVIESILIPYFIVPKQALQPLLCECLCYGCRAPVENPYIVCPPSWPTTTMC
jgi:hypothetical protein